MKIKRSILAILALAAASSVGSAQELTYDWGVADTVAHHSVGPGMMYAKVIYPQKPVILWYVELDLTNPYAKVEQVQSRHAVPDPLRWDVMTHYKENSRPGHRVRVAWNHDFFSYDAGVCIGLNISEGEVTWTRWGRSLLAIDDTGHASVFYPDMDTYVTADDGTRVDIDYYNALNGGLYGDCVLYNRFNSKTLTESGRYIGLRPLDPWRVNGDPIRCEVTAVGTEPLATTADGQNYVLFLRGAKETALDGHVAVGQILTVTQNMRPSSWCDVPRRILNAFHGYPSIVHNGVLHDGEFNNFENGREYEKSSRVMVGINREGTKMYIATTEMSNASTGVDCIELSAWLVERGAWDVVNFDSGGSAAIVIDGDMLNLPGRGSIRPVQDAMLAVSLAPDDNDVSALAFNLQRINPFVISRTPLTVMAFNKFGEVLDPDLEGCEFEVVPPSLGYVDADGVFHSSDTEGPGVIIARKNGQEARLDVLTHNVTDIVATYPQLLTDHSARLITGIKGTAARGQIDLDPGAFTWTASPAGIVEIDSEGMMSGVTNGTATVTGKFHDITVSLEVTVEMPEARMVLNSMSNLSALGFTKSASVKNAVFSTSDLPDGWISGTSMSFDLATGRSTTAKISPDMKLYSVPDSISFRLYDQNGAVSQVQFNLVDAQGTRINRSIPASPGDRYYTLPFTDDEGVPYGLHRYPLTLKTVTCHMANKSLPGSHVVFGPLEGYYRGYDPDLSVPSSVAYRGALTIRRHPGAINVDFPSTSGTTYVIRLLDIAGTTVQQATCKASEATSTSTLYTTELSPGIYFVEVTGPSTHLTAKTIIR